MKKNIFWIMVIMIITCTTACGKLNPSKVDKKYVQKRMEKDLVFKYGVQFVVNVTDFDENSKSMSSKATAYIKDNSDIKCNISGNIQKKYIDTAAIGSSYETYTLECRWAIEKYINDKLSNKNYFEINSDSNFQFVASNIKNYMKEMRSLLEPYKKGNEFKYYFDKKYLRADINLYINGKLNKVHIIIDNNNDKVVIDTSYKKDGWVGELELEEYLEKLVDGTL